VRVVTAVAICVLSAATAACATASSDDEGASDARPAGGDDGGTPDRPDARDDGVVASSCPQDQFATGFDESGALTCAPIDAAALAAVNDHCSLYLGWRDDCNGCTSPPAKWGAVSGSDCANGAGAANTCVGATLDGADVELFGLNTDGDVDGNDKLYLGWHCVPPVEENQNGPCPEGTFLWAVAPAGVECVTARDIIADYARSHCTLYAGTRDSCDGCTTPPAKWGRVSGTDCMNGAGADNTCTTPTLGDQTVETFGLNTDGDVNDDDKFYLGFQCGGAEKLEEEVDRSCPVGQLVVAVGSDGRVNCESPLVAAEAAIQTGCQLYLGWRDSCNGCTSPPAKWGRVSHADCASGAGANGTCAPADLGGVSVPLFGLNTDGDVDGNDKFYVGLRCQ
jgi:hypothetical protein